MTDRLSFSVVFVHGLRGDAFDTWTSGTVCWPRELLAKELKNSRIISVSQDFTEPPKAILILKQWGYDSTIANLKNFSSQNSIFSHATNLLGDIAGKRRSDDQVCAPGNDQRISLTLPEKAPRRICWP
jgi:hypothetical protein